MAESPLTKTGTGIASNDLACLVSAVMAIVARVPGVNKVRWSAPWVAVAAILAAFSMPLAIAAELSRAVAVAGDEVVLETVGVPSAYTSLAEQGPLEVYMASETHMPADPCDAGQAVPIGRMNWTVGVGRLDFTVPTVSPDVYSFHLKSPAMIPDCWRIGPRSPSPLTLTIVASNSEPVTPSTDVATQSTQSEPAVGVIAAIIGLLAAGAITVGAARARIGRRAQSHRR